MFKLQLPVFLLPLVTVAMYCTPTPAGCWSDMGTRVIDVEIVSSTHMSSEVCTDSCAGLGYTFAGLTGHYAPNQTFYCYCGSSINPSAVQAPDSDCNTTCPDGAPVPCGGNYRMSLYNATNCDSPLPTPGQSLNGTACSQPETIYLPFCNTSLTFSERTRDLVNRITLAEIGPQLTARNSPPISRLGITAYYWGANFVHGITNSASGGTLCLNESCVTIWPSGPGLGASWNATSWNTMGAAAADEYRALNNANWGPVARGVKNGMDALDSWGPTINLLREPRWGRVQESFSEDPFFNGIASTNIVRGLQEGEDPRYLKVAATLKHFAVYSLEQFFDATDNFTYTRENINNLASPFDLADSYFPHFQQAVSPVASGGGAAAGVMMAMNEVNSVPSLASSQLINQLRLWGGKDSLYIATDGGNMIDSMIALEPKGHSYCPYHTPPCTREEGVTLAVQAGSDIADGSEYSSSLFDTVVTGNLTLGEAQQRLYYTLLIRMRLGLFDDLANQPYAQIGPERLGAPASRAAALLASKESLVLLENDVKLPQIALPWIKTGNVPLTIIGFAANSTQSLISNYVNQVCPNGGGYCYPSIVQSIEALGVNIADFQLGCTSAAVCPSSLSAAAIAAASVPNRRILLVLGLDQHEEGEQHDREVTGLPADQEVFVNAVLLAASAAGNALAAVIIHGGAVSLSNLKAAGVPILDAFYPGPFGGEAIASALFGDYNPGGKLPYTVYDEQYATAVAMPDMRIAAIGRTYRYHADSSPGGPPLWRFGTGKSYTTFTTTFTTPPPPSLTLTPSSPSIPITLTITNTGNVMDGDEVLQAYFIPIIVSAPQPPFLPLRALFAFKRVHVPHGNAVEVTINVNALLMPLTLSDGTRGPIDGEYTIVFSRGEGGQELTLNATLVGW